MVRIIEYVISSSVITLLSAVFFLLIARSVLLMLAPDSDHPVANFIFNAADFFLSPARYILDKTGWFGDSPLDMANLFTSLALIFIMFLFLLL